MGPRNGGRININADQVFIDDNLGVPEIGFRKLGADGQHAIAGLQHFLNLRVAHAIAEAEGMIFAHGALARRGRHNGAAQFFGDLQGRWASIQGAAAQEDDGSLCAVELFGAASQSGILRAMVW